MRAKRKRRSAIVPAVVFATAISAAVVPALVAGCDHSPVQLSVAFQSVAADFAAQGVADLGFSVAADFAAPSVADLGFKG